MVTDVAMAESCRADQEVLTSQRSSCRRRRSERRRRDVVCDMSVCCTVFVTSTQCPRPDVTPGPNTVVDILAETTFNDIHAPLRAPSLREDPLRFLSGCS